MRRKIIPYNPKLVPLARKLRNNSTLSEILLWQKIRKKQVLGYDFDRQKPLGDYIVDFYCKELMLAIEIDGCSHHGNADYDMDRQSEIEEMEVTVLRFDDLDIKQDMDAVLKELKYKIRELERKRV